MLKFLQMSLPKILALLSILLFFGSCKNEPISNSKESTTKNSTKKNPTAKSANTVRKTDNVPVAEQRPSNKSSFSKSEENAKIDHKRINLNLLEILIHEEINKARKANGLQPLANDLTLRKAAVDQNNYCVRKIELSHTQTTPGKRTIKDRVQYYGNGYTVMAENLIYEGFTVRRTNGKISDIITPSYRKMAKTMVLNWMKSPGHRANIVEKDLKLVGTAVAYNPSNYAIYATQVFGAKL